MDGRGSSGRKVICSIALKEVKGEEKLGEAYKDVRGI